MAVIDSDNFITHLVWSGLIDKATCGELKKAIELCTVKDIYTKADMVTMLEELKKDIIELPFPQGEPEYMKGYSYCQMNILDYVVQQKIDKLRGNENE